MDRKRSDHEQSDGDERLLASREAIRVWVYEWRRWDQDSLFVDDGQRAKHQWSGYKPKYYL